MRYRSPIFELKPHSSNTADPFGRKQYLPQLDALRAMAVFAVMLDHFVPGNAISVLSPAQMGVELFFALSGFLITGILLRCRDISLDISSAGLRKGLWVMRQFYIRRFLRICPIYYLVLACTFVVGLPPVRETILWHLTYTSNVLIALKGNWIGPFGHFWTLSVEEQYYLFWPWFILFLPHRWLLPTILLSIAASPIYALLVMLMGWNDFFMLLVFRSLRTLGVGALLAFCYHNPHNYSAVKLRLSQFGLFIGAPMFGMIMILRALGVTRESTLLEWFCHELVYLTSLFFFFWLLDRASSGFKGTLGRLMERREILYLGKISYGIYVYHNFMPWFTSSSAHHLGLNFPKEGALRFVVLVVTTVTVASLSWHFLEKPLNNLKRKFSYV